MKILFTRFPLKSIPHGGAETQVMNLAKGLAKRGHDISFAGSCGALGPAFREEHFSVIDLSIGPPPVSARAIARFALFKKSMANALETLLTQTTPQDVLIMLSLTEKLLLTNAAVQRGIKVIWIEHDPVGRWLTSNPWLKNLKQLSQRVTTVTVSNLSREQYLEMDWHPKKTTAIPNGIDDTWFQEKPTARITSDTMHLGYVGRLAEEKGVDLLLRAVANVDRTTIDIVGDGTEESALKHRAERLGLGHRARFHGRRTDIADFYRQIDALVLPSRTIDPFGMVVAEAMAMGVPCLLTDACGIASHIRAEHDAIVVERDSIRGLTKGIRQLQDPETRAALRLNGSKAARQQFAVSTMVDRYETLFTD